MTEPRTYEQLMAEAVRVLTEAARQTRTVGIGEEAKQEQADFAEFLTMAVAGAAANMGGIEEILAGRPGSWEAEYVRQMLGSTVGPDGEQLMEHRTEPLRFVVNVEDILVDYEQWALYDADEQELTQEEFAIAPSYPSGSPELAAALPRSPEQEEAVEGVQRTRDRLEEQREREWAAYGQALADNIRLAAAELLPDLPVPVEVQVVLDYNTEDVDRSESPTWRVWEQAIAATPLPSGLAPRDYPPDAAGRIAHADRDAGRTPRARLDSTQGDLDTDPS